MLHFQSVHFPIALLIIGALFDLLAWFRPQPLFRQVSTLLLFIGTAGGILAVGSGLWIESSYSSELLDTHKVTAIVSLVLAIAAILMHFLEKQWPAAAFLRTLCYVGSVCFITFAAHYGGIMVHGEGPIEKPTTREKKESKEGVIRITPPRISPRKTKTTKPRTRPASQR